MRSGQTLHVITDRNGNIIAAAIAAASSTHASEVQTQITPLEGQSLVVVSTTSEFETLETHEDFRRLTAEFHVPPGKQELVRKRETREPGARP
jgi:hypothetical protein